jgi:hypothetical protein
VKYDSRGTVKFCLFFGVQFAVKGDRFVLRTPWYEPNITFRNDLATYPQNLGQPPHVIHIIAHPSFVLPT